MSASLFLFLMSKIAKLIKYLLSRPSIKKAIASKIIKLFIALATINTSSITLYTQKIGELRDPINDPLRISS
jgi:hypothetical protein